MLTKFFYGFCRLFFKVYCPLSVKGRENLPKGSYIFCSNHCSHMDTPVLMMATGLSFKKFGMIAAKDYFFEGKSKMSFFRYIINLIPINRKVTRETLSEDLANCEQFINVSKGNIILYPEGTRSMSGDMQHFKRGIGLIAGKLNIPIVPAYINGTYSALRKGMFFPRPKKIQVNIGKPFYVSDVESYKEVAHHLKMNIQHLKGELYV